MLTLANFELVPDKHDKTSSAFSVLLHRDSGDDGQPGVLAVGPKKLPLQAPAR